MPLVHVRVEGKDVDRQTVHQALTGALAGVTLDFRHVVGEESELKLPELKSGSFQVNQVIMDYFKDEDEAGLALELWKYLRSGDVDEAKKVAEEHFLKGAKA